MYSLRFLMYALTGLFFTPLAKADSLAEMKEEFVRPAEIPYLKSNPYSKRKETLGKMLFFDPRLSGSDWISCATCHNPALAWGDGLAKGLGDRMGELRRRTPTILNLAWADLLMWDGRTKHLEDQALGPVVSSAEMNMPLDKLLPKLRRIKGYVDAFKKAFEDGEINKTNISNAIGVFERGVVSGNAPFDKWIDGNEDAMSDSAVRGFKLFNKKARCVECHSSWRFTDDSFKDIGIDDNDIGRYAKLKVDAMKHAFKTPGLRNVARRAPFMHAGSLKSLKDVIVFYNHDGDARKETNGIRSLNLTKGEQADLVAFLHALTSDDGDVTVPKLPRN